MLVNNCIDWMEQIIYNNDAPLTERLRSFIGKKIGRIIDIRDSYVNDAFFLMRKKKEENKMYHSDPTANRAIGSVNQEWERMLFLAYRFRTDPRMADRIREPETVFRGIYGRFLTDSIKELEETIREIEEARKKKRKRRR